MNMVNLSTFAEGAVDERFNIELAKVLENLQDLNTDPLKTRKITLTITMKGSEQRNLANVSVDAKTALAPAIGIESTLLLDYDKEGKPVAAELKSGIPGQSFISDQGEVLDDKGKPVVDSEKTEKVVQFR